MRYVMLDTETTGLDPKLGHRVLEIGLVEVIDRSRTQRVWHSYLNPERDIPEESIAIHGITAEKVKDAPIFADVVEDIFSFIGDATVVIHNAGFDLGFLDAECARLGLSDFRQKLVGVIDTLAMAKKQFPGSRKSLDALCERFQISLKDRVLHGALLDAKLLADVYLAMTRGQSLLSMEAQHSHAVEGSLSTAMPSIATIRYADEVELKQNECYFL
jgi:DNA polymerase-3 subunit epsilon